MTNTEIRELTTKELLETLEERKVSLVRMRLNHKVSDVENPMLIRSTRREIARIKTELTARKKAAK